MFQMMNEARVGVGLVPHCWATGVTALRWIMPVTGYKGRHPDAADFSKPMVPIIEHADVRRLLLTQKAYAEAALAMSLYGYRLVDEIESGKRRSRQRCRTAAGFADAGASKPGPLNSD